MRTLKYSIVLMLSATFVGSAFAEENSEDKPDRGEFRQKMVEEFDADGDGKLSDEERETAREAKRGRHGKRGAKGRRGGSGGAGPPDPEKLFEQFDANGDDQLSRDEFRKLAEAMSERHAKHQRGKQRGNRRGKGRSGEDQGRRPSPPDGARGRQGPPSEEGRDFRRSRPLQNPDGRPEQPPRLGGSRGDGGPDGRGARSFQRRHAPNPDEVFDRFDGNDDGQLSREEFMKLSEAMRAMRERLGREGGKRFGEDRGNRRGPPGRRVRDDPRGSGRLGPSRAEFDEGDEVESSPAEDNSPSE